MNIVMRPYDALPCSLKDFRIRDKDASQEDFGHTVSEPDGEYGCADNYFLSYPEPKEGVLEKYGIALDQYKAICQQLEEVLRVGSCGWCS